MFKSKVKASTQALSAEDIVASFAYPTSYGIGSSANVSSLVSSDQVKGHLAALRAFHDFRAKAEAFTHPSIPLLQGMTKDQRFSWLTCLAVQRFVAASNAHTHPTRFHTWCSMITRFNGGVECWPPVDVLTVWHSYLLNPG